MRIPRPKGPKDPSGGRGTVPPTRPSTTPKGTGKPAVKMPKPPGVPGGGGKGGMPTPGGMSRSYGKVSPPGSSLGGAPRPKPGPVKGPRKPR